MDGKRRFATLIHSARPGVWGKDVHSAETPIAVRVVRNADVHDDRHIRWQALPVRWVSERERDTAKVSLKDTLLVSSGYIGKSARLNHSAPGPVIASNFVRIVRPADGVDPGWLFWLLGSHGAIREMNRRAAGTQHP